MTAALLTKKFFESVVSMTNLNMKKSNSTTFICICHRFCKKKYFERSFDVMVINRLKLPYTMSGEIWNVKKAFLEWKIAEKPCRKLRVIFFMLTLNVCWQALADRSSQIAESLVFLLPRQKQFNFEKVLWKKRTEREMTTKVSKRYL